jgi:hypothetical protein
MSKWKLTPRSSVNGAIQATQRFKFKHDLLQAAQKLRDKKQPFIIVGPKDTEWFLTTDGILKATGEK